MSNWTAFKSQFAKLKTNTSACPANQEKNDTDNITITDHTSWINRLGEAGNKPEDWLDYIRLVKSQAEIKDSVEKHNLLSCLFDRAFKAIPSSDNKRNEAYAKLFLEYATVKSQYSPDEAEALLTYARSIVRKFAIVHIAAAEFEAKQGNVSKAKKILEKAKLIEAEPKELVRDALRNLDNGKTDLSLQCAQPARRERDERCSTSSQDSTDEVIPSRLHTAGGATAENLNVKSRNPSVQSAEDTSDGNLTSDTTSLAHFRSVLESAKKQPLRHSQSTPECRQMMKPGSEPIWKRTMGKQIGLPMRVKKMTLPFSQKEEDLDGEEDHTGDGVKPLPTHHQENETFGSHAHTSGYMSMSDLTVPMETGNGKQLASASDFKEPVKYITPLASSTHHNIRLRQCSQAETPSFMELSLAEKSKLDVPSAECKKNLTPVIEAEKQDDHCDKKEMSVDPYLDPEVKPVNASVKGLQVPAGQPFTLPAPNIANSEQVPPSASFGPALSTPSMKNFQNPPIPMTPSMGPMETVTVNGNQYFIWKLVGRGGSAKVYQVFDTQKNTRALKCVDLEDATSMIVNGFKNEIHLLRKLQYCKSVIKMYDFEHNERLNKLFVVMEFGETDLATLFKSRTASGEGIKPQMIRFYWDEMLTAVHALHKEGVIHSDLKPANFMLVAGNLRLIDFGIANAVQQDKTSIFLNTPMGTLNYMSPEAIMESFDGGGDTAEKCKPSFKISIRSDIWSLGCILYNMVYGKTPFQHIRNQLGKLQAITSPNHNIDFPDIGNKNLLDVLKKCLTRDPKSRPTTEQLLAHPYLMEDKKTASPAPSSMSEAMMVNVLQELSKASPRSVQSISQDLIQQLQKGKKIDLSSLPTSKKTEPRLIHSTDTSVNPRVKHEGGEAVVKKVRAPLQCINLHQK